MAVAGRRGAGVRLLPALILSLAALGAMKAAGIVLGGGPLAPISLATAQDAGGAAPGAAAESPVGQQEAAAPPAEAAAPAAIAALTESERAVLASLRARRQELEERERGLVVRENLLRAAEQRIDDKVEELRAMEERIRATIKEKEEAENEQLAGLVSMYEAMKAKSAAEIFDRLPIEIVVGVARRMKPQVMAEVLARMDPAAAQRVTTAMVAISVDDDPFGQELEAIAPE